MSKPTTFRSAASMLLVTTSLAWGLPVPAEELRGFDANPDNLVDAGSAERGDPPCAAVPGAAGIPAGNAPAAAGPEAAASADAGPARGATGRQR